MSFDRERFEELVLYIATQVADDENFGRTKLAKVLFYTDFDAYRDEGAWLTGATYIRMPFGPFPQELAAAEDALEAAGRAELRHDVDEYENKRLIALDAGRARELFEPWQLAFVDLKIQDIASASARRISELSHEYPGWVLAGETGAEIPYSSAYAGGDRPPNLAVEVGRRLAREHQWP